MHGVRVATPAKIKHAHKSVDTLAKIQAAQTRADAGKDAP